MPQLLLKLNACCCVLVSGFGLGCFQKCVAAQPAVWLNGLLVSLCIVKSPYSVDFSASLVRCVNSGFINLSNSFNVHRFRCAMKRKQKLESCPLEAPIIIDWADSDVVSRVVSEVLAKKEGQI